LNFTQPDYLPKIRKTIALKYNPVGSQGKNEIH